jgi:hypothetical protein
MSPLRSRSGGTRTVTTCRRKKRSSRKRPAASSIFKSRLVAATTRTSTLMVSLAPMRRISPSCSTRRSCTCIFGLISPISSRKSVPPVRLLEEPALLAVRPREASALVAEELALEDRLGKGRAVDGDEGLGRARALGVDGARDELLARAALADDEHRGGRRRDLRDRLVDAEHRGALPTMARPREHFARVERLGRSVPARRRRATASPTIRFSSFGSTGLAR